MDAAVRPAIDRVRGAERIASLDVIRGIAILFILFMNIPVMGGYEFILFDERYPTWTAADWWTTFVRMTWMDGTQRGLLELLFGAGILIMARKAMEPDGPVAVADLHYRRNIWLALFGLANAFLLMWFGDILLVYGLAAVFLFPFRKLGPKALCGLAAIFLTALTLNNVGDYRESKTNREKVEQIQAAQASGKKISDADKKLVEEDKKKVLERTQLPVQNADAKKKIADADKAHHSTFTAYWNAQFDGWKFIMDWFWIIEAEIVATMLIGMAFYKWGIIQGQAKRSTYWGLLLVGYGAGMWLRGATEWYNLEHIRGPHWEWVMSDLARLLVTFGHVGLIQLVLTSTFGRKLLGPFQAAGRMPLTVYLGTSLLMMWIVFAPWGLNLFGAWGQAKLMVVAAVIIAVELVAANLWLRGYENGPMEWLWKSLAYQRREPFRKERDVAPDGIPSPI